MILFCNLIGGALAELPEVNGLKPPMLPDSFLLCTERGNEPGDEAKCSGTGHQDGQYWSGGTVMVKMDPPKLVPPGTNFSINKDSL